MSTNIHIMPNKHPNHTQHRPEITPIQSKTIPNRLPNHSHRIATSPTHRKNKNKFTPNLPCTMTKTMPQRYQHFANASLTRCNGITKHERAAPTHCHSTSSSLRERVILHRAMPFPSERIKCCDIDVDLCSDSSGAGVPKHS